MTGSGTFSGTITMSTDTETLTGGDQIGGATVVTVVSGTTPGTTPAPTGTKPAPSEPEVKLNTYNAGADVTVTLSVTAGSPILGGRDIRVTLEGFGIPSSIDKEDVILDGGTGSYYGNPEDVFVSGSTITLTLPTRVLSSSGGTVSPTISGSYTILFKSGAGLTNPTSAGNKTIKVTGRATDAPELKVTIKSVVSVKPKSGTRGTEATVTGSGLATGLTADLEVFAIVGSGVVRTNVGSGVVGSNGTLEVKVDTSQEAFKSGGNYIVVMVDGSSGGMATFTIIGKVEVTPETTVRAKDITIKLSDWTAGPVTMVKIGGKNADLPDGVDAGTEPDDMVVVTDNKAEFKVMVPPAVALGVHSVDVYVGTGADLRKEGSSKVTIGTLSLSVSPAAAVMGERVTVTGSGFTALSGRSKGEITSIKVGGADVPNVAEGIDIVSGGSVSFTFMVPVDPLIKTGKDNTVRVTAHDGKEGTATLAIIKPVITLDSVESRIGSTVPVDGKGFLAGRLVTVLYGTAELTAVLADSTGSFSTSFSVPGDAVIGMENNVKAMAERAGVKVEASTKHKTPDASISVTPAETQPGNKVTISGINFRPHTSVNVLKINDLEVTPSPKPITNADGFFSAEVTAPFAALGDRTVSITVGSGNTATTKTIFIKYVAVSMEPEVVAPEVAAELSASPSEVTSGDSLTISGANLPANMSVIKLDVGGMSVLPVGLITTSDGSFTATVMTPELDAGEQEIEAVVSGDDPVSTMVTVLADVSTDPADVFESLGDRLLRVWYLDRAIQDWDFYDPDPEFAAFNTLTEVTSGMNVSIIINQGDSIEFQGGLLYQGTNPIALK